MTWNEADHPRDEQGRFTYGNGGQSENTDDNGNNYQYGNLFKLKAEVFDTDIEMPKDTLYKKDKLEQEQKAKENSYRNKLLNVLGKLATPADALYGSIKKLEKKIVENGLGGKLDKIKGGISTIGGAVAKPFYKKGAELAIGKMYKLGGYQYAKNVYGKDTTGMLDMSHQERMDFEYTKDAIELKNFDDERVASDKKYLVEKLNSQFNNEYAKITNIENIKGYFFKNSSEPSRRISNDPDFRKVIRDNKDDILSGKLVSMEFPLYKDNKKSNLHYAFGHVDIRNGYIDNEGNLHIKVYDTYDFNKKNMTTLNQAGYNQMIKGNLKPYFTIHDIIIPRNVIDTLWQ